jgi:hypothetical protein
MVNSLIQKDLYMYQLIYLSADIMEKALVAFKPRNLGRLPRLDTILMVEKALYKYKSDKTITQIWRLLPKKVMWTTFTTILDYLEYSGKIHIEKDKTVTWIWNPEGLKEWKRKGGLVVA